MRLKDNRPETHPTRPPHPRRPREFVAESVSSCLSPASLGISAFPSLYLAGPLWSLLRPTQMSVPEIHSCCRWGAPSQMLKSLFPCSSALLVAYCYINGVIAKGNFFHCHEYLFPSVNSGVVL